MLCFCPVEQTDVQKNNLKLLFILWNMGQPWKNFPFSLCPTADFFTPIKSLSTGHPGTGHRSQYDREVCHRHCLWPHLPLHLWALPNNNQVRTNRTDINTLSSSSPDQNQYSMSCHVKRIWKETCTMLTLCTITSRSLAVGSGSMMCRVGSVVAPFCVYLADVWVYLPQVNMFSFVCSLRIADISLCVFIGYHLVHTAPLHNVPICHSLSTRVFWQQNKCKVIKFFLRSSQPLCSSLWESWRSLSECWHCCCLKPWADL